MRTFTEEQLKAHGELILEWLKDPSIKIEYRSYENEWHDIYLPSFHSSQKYRKKPKPKVLYTNSIGEVFTEVNLDDTVYWYSGYGYIHEEKLNMIKSSDYKESMVFTEIFKTERGAFEAGIKKFYKKK